MSTDRSHQPDLTTEPNLTTEIAQLFPRQGDWTEADYFALPDTGIVELVDGRIEVIEMPSILHQALVMLLQRRINATIEPQQLGFLFTAPTRLMVADRTYREPDLLYVSQANRRRHTDQYFEAADLVIEVVSPDRPERDWNEKRRDYAQAGVPEYWIVDIRDESVSVLGLRDRSYEQISRSVAAGVARSGVIPGLQIDVADLFKRAGNL